MYYNTWHLINRAETMEIQRVSSIELAGAGVAIEVRALRKWNPRYRPQDTDYVFVDAHVKF